MRLGSDRVTPVGVSVIAATDKRLNRLVIENEIQIKLRSAEMEEIRQALILCRGNHTEAGCQIKAGQEWFEYVLRYRFVLNQLCYKGCNCLKPET